MSNLIRWDVWAHYFDKLCDPLILLVIQFFDKIHICTLRWKLCDKVDLLCGNHILIQNKLGWLIYQFVNKSKIYRYKYHTKPFHHNDFTNITGNKSHNAHSYYMYNIRRQVISIYILNCIFKNNPYILNNYSTNTVIFYEI